MILRDIKAYDLCEHCHRAFADHNYVENSIDVYLCPSEVQSSHSYGYGYFRERPDCFSPDSECCSPEEIENHRRAEAEFERCKANGIPFVCPPGSWGIGVYWVSEQTEFKLAMPIDPAQGEFEFGDSQ